MGRKRHAPKHGSLAYMPRKRAKRIVARIRSWPQIEGEPTLLAFAGYKAGTTHLFVLEEKPGSPLHGKEVMYACTVIATPPMFVCAIRAYESINGALRSLSEVWSPVLPDEINRVITTPKKKVNLDESFKKLEERIDQIKCLRVILATQPKKLGLKKKPELMEVQISGGTIKEQLEYAKRILGKEIRVSDVLKEGMFVDVIAVTKGKGFQGAVKRWHVRLLSHKSRKKRRGVGTLGPWHPAHVMYTVPQAGQMGFHQRTEFSKLILKIGENGEEVTPKGGFLEFGVVRGDYIILKGSTPGPAKRLVKLRYGIRVKPLYITPPKITYISLESPQGA